MTSFDPAIGAGKWKRRHSIAPRQLIDTLKFARVGLPLDAPGKKGPDLVESFERGVFRFVLKLDDTLQ